jgi:hypothetical protein
MGAAIPGDGVAVEALRDAILASLKRRDPNPRLEQRPTESDRAMWVSTWCGGEATQRAYTATPSFDALLALAIALGLRRDGSDPEAEVERLREELARSAATADRLCEQIEAANGCAIRDRETIAALRLGIDARLRTLTMERDDASEIATTFRDELRVAQATIKDQDAAYSTLDHFARLNESALASSADVIAALRTQIETLTAERDAVVTVVDTAKIHGARRSLADRVAVLASMFETVQSEARDAEAEAQSLRGSCASLTESIESAHAVAKAAGVPSGTVADQMAALVAKRDERRDEAVAIILGRDTGPTDAEIEAHAKSGGLWRALRVSVGVTTSMDVLDGIGARAIRDMAAHLGHGMTWWALDASGCPCAWPVVAAEVSHA